METENKFLSAKILIIDEDVNMMEILSDVLTKYGHSVSTFTEPVSAIEELKANKYDILLVNYLMSPVSGDRIVELVREFDKEIYIILMSMHRDLAPSIETMQNLDIQAYFEKSSRFDQLIMFIQTGIKYIEEALKKGAIGCITEYDIPQEILEKNNDKIMIKVKDVIQSIQDLARYKRSLFDIPIVAITGSVGKTTTKDMISNVLMQKYNVAKTQGNYNNHIGVPITILNWNESTEAAVVEMGMNHFGEISLLTNIAKPTIAVITNIGTAHIGILRLSRKYIKSKTRNIRGIK